jgi:hypothetical protein
VTLLVSIYDTVVSVQQVSLTLIGKGESRALLAAMSSLIPSLSGLGFPPKIILERPSVLTGLDSDPAMGAFNESNPARVPRGDLWDGATVGREAWARGVDARRLREPLPMPTGIDAAPGNKRAFLQHTEIKEWRTTAFLPRDTCVSRILPRCKGLNTLEEMTRGFT